MHGGGSDLQTNGHMQQVAHSTSPHAAVHFLALQQQQQLMQEQQYERHQQVLHQQQQHEQNQQQQYEQYQKQQQLQGNTPSPGGGDAFRQLQPWQKVQALAAHARQAVGMGPAMRAPAVGGGHGPAMHATRVRGLPERVGRQAKSHTFTFCTLAPPPPLSRSPPSLSFPYPPRVSPSLTNPSLFTHNASPSPPPLPSQVELSEDDIAAQHKAAASWSREVGPNATLSQLLTDVVRAARAARPAAQRQHLGTNPTGGDSNGDGGRGEDKDGGRGEQGSRLWGAASEPRGGGSSGAIGGGGGGLSQLSQGGLNGFLLDEDIEPAEAVEVLFSQVGRLGMARILNVLNLKIPPDS
eukprot:116705-Chlamydomonas_euryale.AAC.4